MSILRGRRESCASVKTIVPSAAGLLLRPRPRTTPSVGPRLVACHQQRGRRVVPGHAQWDPRRVAGRRLDHPWTDPNVALGATYTYALVAVDTSGNTGPAATVTVPMPSTPRTHA